MSPVKLEYQWPPQRLELLNYQVNEISSSNILFLKDMVRSGRIGYPSKKEAKLEGLFDIKPMGLLMASSNLIGMFILGLTMTSTMNFSVAEGICVVVTLFFHEITQKLSDYIHYQVRRF